MKLEKYFYITTTLPYVNAEPHIGFALEIIKADVMARYRRQQGDEVFFNTGVDEHGLKIYRKAEALGLDPQVYCDQMAEKFSQLQEALNLSYNSFIRTTDERHSAAAQAFWRLCVANGDIYKKNYQVKYCVGCELEKTESDLVDGHCPLHPEQALELIDEENYFFRFSRYQQALLKLYQERPNFVLPASKLKEIEKFVQRGLDDFSISRLKAKMPWGVPVPDDVEQVMYVWFDALVNYISCLNWPDGQSFDIFWPGVQICGKDNLRQQAAMWPAMLLSAGLPVAKQLVINGFVTVDGHKMSKSAGNVVNPLTLVRQYGADATRYYFLAEINSFEDSDFSQEKIAARYAADLVNGLGNLAARVANLLEKNNLSVGLQEPFDKRLAQDFSQKIDRFLFNEALAEIWHRLRAADGELSRQQPWKMSDPQAMLACLRPIVVLLRQTAELLLPIMPVSAEKLGRQFQQVSIKKDEPLFPRQV